MSTIEIGDEIRRNFHLFWDNFPFPVMLVHKDRTIFESNKAGNAIGCPVGTRCSDIGEKKHHQGCLASNALREQTGKRSVGYIEHMGLVLDSYWIPLESADDLYLHFSIDITEFAAEHLFPGKCEEHSCCSCPSA